MSPHSAIAARRAADDRAEAIERLAGWIAPGARLYFVSTTPAASQIHKANVYVYHDGEMIWLSGQIARLGLATRVGDTLRLRGGKYGAAGDLAERLTVALGLETPLRAEWL